MPFKPPPPAPKCPRCGESVYSAEAVNLKIAGTELAYHKKCFKCIDCGLRLTLSTFKVSDFGDEDVFCQKCVPKQAPSQSNESIEVDRTRKAAALFKDVGIVNQQVRGAEAGKGASAATTVDLERAKKGQALSKDVGIVNEQVRGAED
eukprot:m.336082 g.336082  ORF g.336082 m.336082 type:complete len:148 (-) comp17750_c0_seq1:116-559(-)